MNIATSGIRPVGFSFSGDGDSSVLRELLDQGPDDEEVDTVTADGAYDTRRCLTAILCPGVHVYMRERNRPPSHCDHSDPSERPTLERRLSISRCKKRKPCMQHGTPAGRLGNAGLGATPAAATTRACIATRPSECGSQPESRYAKPSSPDLCRSYEPLQCTGCRRHRPRSLSSIANGEVAPQVAVLQQGPSTLGF